jgi:hypothetical protein
MQHDAYTMQHDAYKQTNIPVVSNCIEIVRIIIIDASSPVIVQMMSQFHLSCSTFGRVSGHDMNQGQWPWCPL